MISTGTRRWSGYTLRVQIYQWRVAATNWHIDALAGLGFVIIEHRHIETSRQRFGANGELRMGYESMIRFQLQPERGTR